MPLSSSGVIRWKIRRLGLLPVLRRRADVRHRSRHIDPQGYLVGLTCDEIPDRANNWGGSNVARSCDPEFDGLVEELSHTLRRPRAYAALVKRMNDMLVQSYYEIPLVNRGIVSAHLDALRGVRINGWDSELWNIAEWRR